MPFTFEHLEQGSVMELFRHLIQKSGVEVRNLYLELSSVS